MPFTLRALEDEKKARLAVKECVDHKLLEPFNVLYEKDNEVVAQFKFTILLLPNGVHRITGLPFDASLYESEHKIQDEGILSLLSQPVAPKTKKKKNKKEEGDKAVTNNTPAGDATKA